MKSAIACRSVVVLSFLGSGDDDRFTAAIRNTGDGGLVGHTARKPQHVSQRRVIRGVFQDAAAANGWPQSFIVNGNDCCEPGRLILPYGDQRVTIKVRKISIHYIPAYST
jgi:hypothetical protein